MTANHQSKLGPVEQWSDGFDKKLAEVGDLYHRFRNEQPDATLHDHVTAIAVATGLKVSQAQFYVSILPDIEFEDIYPNYAPPPGL